MYLRHLAIKHLRRISDLKLDFVHESKPRSWTALIGENGTGKTSILQAIALTAAGGLQANGVAKPVIAHLRDRRGETALSLDAEFEFDTSRRALLRSNHPTAPPLALRGPLRLVSRLFMDAGSTTLIGTSRYVHRRAKKSVIKNPLDEARARHTPLWFVAAYGISRFLPASTTTAGLERPSIERLEPLFEPRATLQSTSFANHFLAKDRREGREDGETSRLFGRALNEAIQLGGADLLPDIARLELRGQGGTKSAKDIIESDRFEQRMGKTSHKIPGVALSHGYQSTFAWIADLIGHVLLEADSGLSTTEMEGLVLIDEIDLYLHPTWQASFIPALKRVFPKMQFIVTTHSPVVLSSLQPHEIVRLAANPETGDVERVALDDAGEWTPTIETEPTQPDPRTMTGGELYRHWFGLDRLTPNPHGEELRRYSTLAGDPTRSDSEEKTRIALEKQLTAAAVDGLPGPVKRKPRKHTT